MPVGWGTAAAWYGFSGVPYYYDYGETVYYEDGNVYYGDQVVATQEEYYEQADQIAATGQDTENEEWLPLGVFAVAAEGQTEVDKPEKIVQLAVNREGAIAGSLYDATSSQTTALSGAVDKETQRAAFKPEGNDSVVVETGIYSLTQDQAPVLVHFGADHTEERTLIRQEQPEQSSKSF